MTDLSLCLPCGDIYATDKFIMWRISAHDNLPFGEISPHGRFVSTGTACGACDKDQAWMGSAQLLCAIRGILGKYWAHKKQIMDRSVFRYKHGQKWAKVAG